MEVRCSNRRASSSGGPSSRHVDGYGFREMGKYALTITKN